MKLCFVGTNHSPILKNNLAAENTSMWPPTVSEEPDLCLRFGSEA